MCEIVRHRIRCSRLRCRRSHPLCRLLLLGFLLLLRQPCGLVHQQLVEQLVLRHIPSNACLPSSLSLCRLQEQLRLLLRCGLVHRQQRLREKFLHHIPYNRLRCRSYQLLCRLVLRCFLQLLRHWCDLEHLRNQLRRCRHIRYTCRLCSLALCRLVLLLLCHTCGLEHQQLVEQLALRHIPSNACLPSSLSLCRLQERHCLLLRCDLVHQQQHLRGLFLRHILYNKLRCRMSHPLYRLELRCFLLRLRHRCGLVHLRSCPCRCHHNDRCRLCSLALYRLGLLLRSCSCDLLLELLVGLQIQRCTRRTFGRLSSLLLYRLGQRQEFPPIDGDRLL